MLLPGRKQVWNLFGDVGSLRREVLEGSEEGKVESDEERGAEREWGRGSGPPGTYRISPCI